MSKDFTSHLLSFEEGRFVKDHPFDINSVRVKKAIDAINQTRDILEEQEKHLEDLVVKLNERMATK